HQRASRRRPRRSGLAGGTGNPTCCSGACSIAHPLRRADHRGMTIDSDVRTDLWQADGAMTRRVPRVLTELVRRRTWAETLYALLGLPLGIATFVFVVTTLSVSAG